VVDQGAALIPNDGGKVLRAATWWRSRASRTNLSFIFDPASQTFTKTTGSLITPRTAPVGCAGSGGGHRLAQRSLINLQSY
jgi:hypothetical protein